MEFGEQELTGPAAAALAALVNVGRGGLALGMLTLVAVMSPAQERATKTPATAKKKSKELCVTIVCSAWGKQVPRQLVSKEEPRPHRLVGHAVRWHVGLKRLDSISALGDELYRLRRDRSQWVSDAHNPGRLKPPPVRIDAGARVCVGDVVRTYDTLMESGFIELRVLRPKPRFLWIPMAVSAEPGSVPEPLPPACLYAQPYEPDPKRWSVTIEVLQDGRIRSEGAVLYDPNRQGSDLTRLRQEFTAWKQKARRLKLTSTVKLEGDTRTLADVPILIRADEWTPWKHVRRLMELAMEPELQFWINYLAVVEKAPEKQPPDSRPSKSKKR